MGGNLLDHARRQGCPLGRLEVVALLPSGVLHADDEGVEVGDFLGGDGGHQAGIDAAGAERADVDFFVRQQALPDGGNERLADEPLGLIDVGEDIVLDGRDLVVPHETPGRGVVVTGGVLVDLLDAGLGQGAQH